MRLSRNSVVTGLAAGAALRMVVSRRGGRGGLTIGPDRAHLVSRRALLLPARVERGTCGGTTAHSPACEVRVSPPTVAVTRRERGQAVFDDGQPVLDRSQRHDRHGVAAGWAEKSPPQGVFERSPPW